MAAIEESSTNLFVVDHAYEFSAPKFYDFLRGETDQDIRKAERWLEDALSHAPSPFMPRIKAIRSVQPQLLCNFDDDEQPSQALGSSEAVVTANAAEEPSTVPPQAAPVSAESKEVTIVAETILCNQENCLSAEKGGSDSLSSVQGAEVTPAPSKKSDSKKLQSAKRIASLLKNPSAMKSNQLQKSQAKGIQSVQREKVVGTPKIAVDNPAIKKQKLDGGKSRQILTVAKPSNLPHKTRLGTTVSTTSNLCPSAAAKTCKVNRQIYVREQAVPFVSTAEMMKKFQSSTREVSLPRSSSVSQSNANGTIQRKMKLTLTKPKTPEFETSQRVRLVKIKSSVELEEEMLVKVPKFKAHPLNKKILEAPTKLEIQKSTPNPPLFKEFHLETMSRAMHKAETSSVVSTESSAQNNNQQCKLKLTMPKSPLLQTYLRARPPRIKSSVELEKEELENMPQFKARPLNRKIFESKGEMGLSANMKKPITIPQEFQFALDKRIPPPTAVADMFDKLSLVSESCHEKPLPRMTTPDPFHLHTEERGAEKEKRAAEELAQKLLEEEKARVPKALPYPYTTDYPVIPPKPEPKPSTKQEPFQLESVVRHEERMHKELEERRRMEMEEARMRMFKAQPILKEDPIPVPEIERKPLTEVQDFNLHVNQRASERAEFDKKIKEKETTYKRYRDEAESARMMEEEKSLKQLRRTLVPHARAVPNFDHPFLPQRSAKGVTKAKSPKLHVNRRNEVRRAAAAAVSRVAASHMR